MTGYRTAEEINRRMVVMAVVMSTFCVVVGLCTHRYKVKCIYKFWEGAGEDNTPIRGRNRVPDQQYILLYSLPGTTMLPKCMKCDNM